MNRGTKAQMVEFINKRCRVNGKKIPKKQLNQIEKEKLLEIINSQPAMAEAYKEFLKVDNMLVVTIPPRKGYEDAALKLEQLVNRVVMNPKSFMALTEVQNFIGKLPYGSVPYETLNRLAVKAGECEPGIAFLLLEYCAKQEEYRAERLKEQAMEDRSQ